MGWPAVAILTSIIRPEEKSIIQSFEAAGLAVDRVDVRKLVMTGEDRAAYRLVINRSISGLHAVAYFESKGSICLNNSRTIEICGNKALTAMAFERHGIPCPRWKLALGPDAVITAIEDMGYPVVLKPIVGSWGRLVTRIDDRNGAENVIDYREALPGSQNGVYFLQECIDKPGRDIRVIVMDHEVIAVYARYSDHWKTNVKRGARAEAIALTSDIEDLARRTSEAVGGGFLAIDLLECPLRGTLVNEVNHTPEFQAAISATSVDIASALTTYVRRCLS